MTSAQNIIDTAKKHLGEGGSNFIKAYNSSWSSSTSWCCIFCWYVFNEAGAPELFYGGSKTALCRDVYNWAKRWNLLVDVSYGLPGDLILFEWYDDGDFNDVDHIGIIISNNGNGTYTTIEGNTSGSTVAIKTRYVKNVYGIVRVEYDGIDTISGNNNFNSNNVIKENSNIGLASDVDAIVNEETKSIVNSRTSHNNTNELATKIDEINAYIGNTHDTTAYVRFKVNDFELDTRNPNSFRHYAISLENQKTGVGQGNQFKLKIAFHKDFSENTNGEKYNDINDFEKALGPLAENSLIKNSLDSIKADVKKNSCELEYGYLNHQISEPIIYTGLLLKYSVNANKQIVEYTLEGFTGEQVSINTVNWYPDVSGMDKKVVTLETGEQIEVPVAELTNKNSNDRISEEQLAEIVRKLNSQYKSGITMQPYLALNCFLQDYNNSTDINSTKYFLVDCTGRAQKLSYNDTLQPVRLALCRRQTPLQYIEYCISLFKYTKNTNYAIQCMKQDNKAVEKFVYYFIRSRKKPNVIYVCIDVIDSTDVNNKITYDFIGYTPNNNLLIDYSLNYDGTVALAISDNDNSSEDSTKAIYIDRDGKLRTRISLTRDMFVAGEIDEILISKQNTWFDKISVANNCSITTFGLPFEISVGTIFNCGIYINNALHHTSGNCFVTGITDTIENNNFTSKFNMIRLPGVNTALNYQ